MSASPTRLVLEALIDRHAPAMHAAGVARLRAAEEALDAEAVGEHPAGAEELAGPFCGCEDCLVREVLHAGVEALLRAV